MSDLSDEEVRQLYLDDLDWPRDIPEKVEWNSNGVTDNSESSILSIVFNTGAPLSAEERQQRDRYYDLPDGSEVLTDAEPVASGSSAVNPSESAPTQNELEVERDVNQTGSESNEQADTDRNEEVEKRKFNEVEVGVAEAKPESPSVFEDEKSMKIPEAVANASGSEHFGRCPMVVDTEDLINLQEPSVEGCISPPKINTEDEQNVSTNVSGRKRSARIRQVMENAVAQSTPKKSAKQTCKTNNADRKDVTASSSITPKTEKGIPTKQQVEQNEFNGPVETISMESFLQSPEEVNLSNYLIPKYSDVEKQRIYADKMFVMDIGDVGKDPSTIHIWQIQKANGILQKFTRSELEPQLFQISSPLEVQQFPNYVDEDFQSRFQPIVVNIFYRPINASLYSFEPTARELEEGELIVVYYPYRDHSFFYRMTKYSGYIHHSESLRWCFMNCLAMLILENLIPIYGSILRLYNFGSWICDEEENFISSWRKVGDVMSHLFLSTASRACAAFKKLLKRHYWGFEHTTPTQGIAIPDGDKRHLLCSFCAQIAAMEVLFNNESINYHPSYLKHEPIKWERNSEFWCQDCTKIAKRYYRVADYFYNLRKILKTKVIPDQAIVESSTQRSLSKYVAELANELSIHWRNTMFLDFQLAIAEATVEAGFDPKICFW